MSKRTRVSRDRKKMTKFLKKSAKKLKYPFYGASLVFSLFQICPIAATVLVWAGCSFLIILGALKVISTALMDVEEWIPQMRKIKKSWSKTKKSEFFSGKRKRN